MLEVIYLRYFSFCDIFILINCNIAGIVDVRLDQMYWGTGWGGIPMKPGANVGEHLEN